MVGMSTVDRARLIADLEAHFGRFLRNAVIMDHQAGDQMIRSWQAREADGRGRSLEMSEAHAKHQEWTRRAYEIAVEGEAAVKFARGIEDDRVLDIFVRWKTLPNWRKAMEDEGWVFDEKYLSWEHPEHGSLIG